MSLWRFLKETFKFIIMKYFVNDIFNSKCVFAFLFSQTKFKISFSHILHSNTWRQRKLVIRWYKWNLLLLIFCISRWNSQLKVGFPRFLYFDITLLIINVPYYLYSFYLFMNSFHDIRSLVLKKCYTCIYRQRKSCNDKNYKQSLIGQTCS